MSHTPGPWKIRSTSECLHVIGAGEHIIAEVGQDDAFRMKEEDANSRLIAAAPELLQACQDAIEYFDCGTPIRSGSILDSEIRAAVAKATGQSAAAPTTD